MVLGLFVLFVGLCGVAPGQYATEFNDLGIEAYNQGRYVDAIAYFEKASENAPGSAVVLRNWCNAYQMHADQQAKQGDFREAVRTLERVVRLDPSNPAPLVQMGSYLLRLDHVQEAIFRLEEAVELKPGEIDAHELLGEAYYRDNDLPSARAQWDYVIEMDPKRNSLRERYEKAFREESVESDFNRAGSRHFRISYPKGMPTQLRARVLTILERAYLDIGRKMGAVYPPGPIQVIVYDAEQFSQATQLEANVGAVYDGKIRVPLTTQEGELLDDEELKRRLTHEYVHVVVRHLVGDKVPWWVNEGLAETFSGMIEPGRADLLRRIYAQDAAFGLAELEAHQLRILDTEALRLAYAQSHATMDLLWSRFGQRRLEQFLGELAAGTSPEEALRRTYRRNYANLEAEVAVLFQ